VKTVRARAGAPASGCYDAVVTSLVLGLAVLLLGQAAPARPAATRGGAVRPPAPAGLSWEDADRVARTVARVERRLAAGKPAARQTLVVTERQLNSWVNLSLASKMPEGLSGLALGLQKDRLSARGTVDLDRVKAKIPPGVGTGFLAFLSGTVPVEVRGRFSSAEGKGRIELEEALVAGVSLPTSLVAQLVTQSTRSAARPQGFDILSPFPLPFTARQVRLEPGRALVDFFQ
jgi:hypothetical protein